MEALMQHSQLPGGIIDSSTEVFSFNEKLYAVHSGKTYEFFDLPSVAKQPFIDKLLEDDEALSLLQSYGVFDFDDQLSIYVKCLFGGFNNTPDYHHLNGFSKEHWDCKCETPCPLHSIARGRFKVANGYLTRREIELCVRISQGNPGKVIASEMGISPVTLDQHKKKIFNKTGFQNSIEISVWVVQNNIHHYGK